MAGPNNGNGATKGLAQRKALRHHIWPLEKQCFMEIPHNTAAHLAVPFLTRSESFRAKTANCRFLDLPPVNLRNLQLHLSKNSLAS